MSIDHIADLEHRLDASSRRSAQWCATAARLSEQTFDHYAERAKRTAAPWQDGPEGLAYFVAKLNGEAGEVAELVFKHFRRCEGIASAKGLTDEQREALKLELGDVLWYVSQIARICDLPLQEVADANTAKLAKRHKVEL